MSTILLQLALAASMLALVFGLNWYDTQRQRAQLEAELERLGLELIDAEFWTSGSKYNRSHHFSFQARRPDDPGVYAGNGTVLQGAPMISWDGANPMLEDHHAALAQRDLKEQAAGLTVDQEVAMRLDAITATPGAMLEHDLDGSGHIDSAEWDALRAKVRAEVEAARAARASGDDAPAEDSHAEPEDDAPSGAAW